MATIAGFLRNFPDFTIEKLIERFKSMPEFEHTGFTVVSRSVVITDWPLEVDRGSFSSVATTLGFDCQYL